MKLPRGQSAFLWGARKTGKTTFLRDRFPKSRRYDLLETDLFLRLAKEPRLLREEVAAMKAAELSHPIVIDEVQKVPQLLDEVHGLIENHGASFILCGSSARKLKRGAANLLGGRAWRYSLLPLTYREVPGFELERALRDGLIPAHYLGPEPDRSLKAYVSDYLQEEIRAEGLTRNLPAFSRFLDSLAFTNGELVNYANVARDCGVDAKTVREYYQILVDTMLGYLISPFTKRAGREIILATPKFYCFDTGLARLLSGEKFAGLRGPLAGRLFENFILMELVAYRAYRDLDFPIAFWRTKTGLEVDFVLDGRVPVEVKLERRLDHRELRGLKAFLEEQKLARGYFVCDEPRPRRVSHGSCHIDVVPWKDFLDRLWDGEILK